MEQIEKNKLIDSLKKNIKILQETIEQQEFFLVELLKELDKINHYDADLNDNNYSMIEELEDN